jgi:hypothetical protein
MDKTQRRAAITAYKERPAQAGVFAVRCATTGEVWVGRSPRLAAQQTSLWFQLRHGGGPHASLRAAWAEHGEGAFMFEILDAAPEHLTAIGRDEFLKARLEHWRRTLEAKRI